MWKFHNFSIARHLREIDFEDSKRAKSGILTHLEPQNFEFSKLKLIFIQQVSSFGYQRKLVRIFGLHAPNKRP